MLGVVRMGMWGSVGDAFNGRRVVVRPDAWKRLDSSRRMQTVRFSLVLKEKTASTRSREKHTVKGFPLHLQNSFILADIEMEFLVGVCDGAELVLFVDLVSDHLSALVVMQSLRSVKLTYPSFSRSAGNTGSFGKVLLNRRNMVMT